MGKYYWLKLQKDFFKRHDIRIIEAMPNGKDYILFYLKLLVESVSHEGELRFSDTVPYNEDMLAVVTNTNVDIVRSAMKVFTELGMIEILEDQTLFMSEVQKMIGSASDSPNALKQQRYRDRKKALAVTENNPEVTNRYDAVTDTVTNNNESKSKSKSKSQSQSKSKDNKPVRHKYGEYKNVLLSDEELEKLKDEFPDWETRIERLSEYMASTGKSYKNHLATIRNWARKEKPKQTEVVEDKWATFLSRGD